MALSGPASVYVMPNGNMYVVDRGNNRVQKYPAGSQLGTTLVGNGAAGSGSGQLDEPMGLYVDALTEDVYVADCFNYRVQKVSSVNITLQGSTVVGPSSSPSVYGPFGVQFDAQGNLYVSDWNQRVIKWSPNATIGIMVAGTGTLGSTASSFNLPDIFDLDASGEYVYVPDRNNNRIQKWKLPFNGSSPATAGVTVAGGNGAGNLPNQLNSPHSVYVSKKTGAIYIADSGNNRVQRWQVGATEGVTVAGSPQGVSSAGPAELDYPEGVFLDANETYLYVADQGNNRVQRFTLI
jgi:DNA-binding beta-propeller fold protein YncE